VADYGVKLEEKRSDLAKAEQRLLDAICALNRSKATTASRPATN
jgi:hypothetical protein